MQGRVEILSSEYIERMAEIESAAQISPWTVNLIRECFNCGCRRSVLGYLDETGFLLGFLVYSVLEPESELENISVDPLYQDRGIGTSLMNAYCDILDRKGCDSSFLEVRASNERALHLYARCGYLAVGNRKNYYRCADGSREDAVMMKLKRNTK